MLDRYSSAITTVIVLQSVTSVIGLTCYQCIVGPSQNSNLRKRSCSNFTRSPEYEVNCPYSAFCMKKTFRLPINDGVVITQRDCAPQKEMYPVERNGMMVWDTRIADNVYTEGCLWRDNSHRQKINTEEVCYCETPLCNGQPSQENGRHTDMMGVILIYNIIKYVKALNDY